MLYIRYRLLVFFALNILPKSLAPVSRLMSQIVGSPVRQVTSRNQLPNPTKSVIGSPTKFLEWVKPYQKMITKLAKDSFIAEENSGDHEVNIKAKSEELDSKLHDLEKKMETLPVGDQMIHQIRLPLIHAKYDNVEILRGGNLFYTRKMDQQRLERLEQRIGKTIKGYTQHFNNLVFENEMDAIKKGNWTKQNAAELKQLLEKNLEFLKTNNTYFTKEQFEASISALNSNRSDEKLDAFVDKLSLKTKFNILKNEFSAKIAEFGPTQIDAKSLIDYLDILKFKWKRINDEAAIIPDDAEMKELRQQMKQWSKSAKKDLLVLLEEIYKELDKISKDLESLADKNGQNFVRSKDNPLENEESVRRVEQFHQKAIYAMQKVGIENSRIFNELDSIKASNDTLFGCYDGLQKELQNEKNRLSNQVKGALSIDEKK